MLGWSTLYDDIELNGGDWIFERTNSKGVFPSDTTAEVKWANGVTWDATIDGADMKWRIRGLHRRDHPRRHRIRDLGALPELDDQHDR